MHEPVDVDVTEVQTSAMDGSATVSAGEAARRWRATLPGELRRRSLMRAGLLLIVPAVGYLAGMVGAVWGPDFFWRTISLGTATVMIGTLFVIGHDAAHNSFTPFT